MRIEITRTEQLLIETAIRKLEHSADMAGQHKQNEALYSLKQKLKLAGIRRAIVQDMGLTEEEHLSLIESDIQASKDEVTEAYDGLTNSKYLNAVIERK